MKHITMLVFLMGIPTVSSAMNDKVIPPRTWIVTLMPDIKKVNQEHVEMATTYYNGYMHTTLERYSDFKSWPVFIVAPNEIDLAPPYKKALAEKLRNDIDDDDSKEIYVFAGEMKAIFNQHAHKAYTEQNYVISQERIPVPFKGNKHFSYMWNNIVLAGTKDATKGAVVRARTLRDFVYCLIKYKTMDKGHPWNLVRVLAHGKENKKSSLNVIGTLTSIVQSEEYADQQLALLTGNYVACRVDSSSIEGDIIVLGTPYEDLAQEVEEYIAREREAWEERQARIAEAVAKRQDLNDEWILVDNDSD